MHKQSQHFSGVYSEGQEITIALITNYVGFLSMVCFHMIPQTAGIRECMSTLDASKSKLPPGGRYMTN